MQSDDAYRNELHALIRELRAWIEGFAEIVEYEATEAADYWRLAVMPRAATACPIELILHRNQRYDMTIGRETYEDRPIESLGLFQPLLQAIVEGHVITRTWTTLATGAHHSVETIVDLGGEIWRAEHVNPDIATVAGRDQCAARDRHYAAYHP